MLAPPFRKALENEGSRAILGVLAESGEGIRYSEVRTNLAGNKSLDHPEKFQRALRLLLNTGLVQSRAMPKKSRPPGVGRAVILEASVLGKILWRYEQLKPELLKQAADEYGVELDQFELLV